MLRAISVSTARRTLAPITSVNGATAAATVANAMSREDKALPKTLKVHPAMLLLVVLLLTWSVLAVAHGAPPLFGLLVLFLFLRHRRWSRRW